MGGERVFAPAKVGEAAREVVEGRCEVGREGVRALRSEPAIDLHRLLDGGERILAPAKV